MPDRRTSEPPATSEPPEIEWSEELDAALFRGMCKYKPAGTHKHMNMLGLAAFVADDAAKYIPIASLWQRLAHYYDLSGADAIENSGEQLPFVSQEGVLLTTYKTVFQQTPELLVQPTVEKPKVNGGTRATTRATRTRRAVAAEESLSTQNASAGAGADPTDFKIFGDYLALSEAAAAIASSTGHEETESQHQAEQHIAEQLSAEQQIGFDLPWDEFGDLILEHARDNEEEHEAHSEEHEADSENDEEHEKEEELEPELEPAKTEEKPALRRSTRQVQAASASVSPSASPAEDRSMTKRRQSGRVRAATATAAAAEQEAEPEVEETGRGRKRTAAKKETKAPSPKKRRKR